MNQIEIGKFIAKLRKKEKLTQEQLASKLGVTNKTISRWENGNYMPDLSLLIPLCNIFKISVDELLSANIKNNSNDNHEQIINYALEQEKNNKKKFLYLILFIIILCILLIYSFKFVCVWTYLLFLLSINIYMTHKTINNKSNIYILIITILLIIYTLFSSITYNGSVRACVVLMGHPLKAYTTGVYENKDFGNSNYKYFSVDNNIKTISGDMGYVEVKNYGIFKISYYYGY